MNRFYLLLITSAMLMACGNEPHDAEATSVGGYETEVLSHPEWSKNASIYEVNVRQHTEEGTFAAFEADIPRIKSMGIDILWLMPIHPIGELKRKGGMGSYYSIKDYRAVNPEFGSLEDLKSLVNTAHKYDMKVIIDWVANHSAWDNVWIESHPEYYSVNEAGEMYAPVEDWSDVVDLNFEHPGLREAMIGAMKYWVQAADIDGFRCDVAGMVPTDFWDEARKALEQEKPDIFMLAEAEQPEHHARAFDMSYAWEFMHICNNIAAGNKTLAELEAYMAKEDTNFVKSAYRMYFTTNHDENSWNGTVFERYGPAHELYAVLAYTIDGMPLLYSGQEAGNPKRLAFFEKDTLDWGDYFLQDFYTTLLQAKKSNEALWNGEFGGDFKRIKTSADEEIFAYSRTRGKNQVIVLLNFSDQPQLFESEEAISGEYKSIFNDQMLSVFTNGDVKLDPWGYQVFTK